MGLDKEGFTQRTRRGRRAIWPVALVVQQCHPRQEAPGAVSVRRPQVPTLSLTLLATPCSPEIPVGPPAVFVSYAMPSLPS